ncbi:glycosyltransferase [Mycobacterium sp. SMC-4]|uniref:glycosyltransferase n=1 Tax=Mycobacterium sp. SMC-4 TaxID=2857059 RepID=UPI003CFD6266
MTSFATQSEVAIAHDYLTQRGGAEKVVLALARAFPGAPIYTTLYNPGSTYPDFAGCTIRVSWLNSVPILRKFHRAALPFLAIASSMVKIEARVTLVSSSGWAHGFRSRGPKIVYCYSPARWLYQREAYLGDRRQILKRMALRVLEPALKRWDRRSASSAYKYFAISTVVRQRIQEAYGIEAEVLPAPHSIDTTQPQEPVDISELPRAAEDGYYLCISRLLPYKNVDVVMDAVSSLQLPLIIVGTGPEERRLQQKAGRAVLMLKNLTDGQMRWLYANCNAVISASYEDFGLTPIEAAAFGKPSIVLRWGGFLDTVREGVTGTYFDKPTVPLIREAVLVSRERTWDDALLVEHAKGFSEERFVRRLKEEMQKAAGA